MKLNLLSMLLFMLLFTWSINIVAQSEATQPLVVQAVSPIYPEIAVAAGASGNTIIEVQIDSRGIVTSTRTVQGIRLLGAAAEKSARRWVFAPAAKQTESRIVRLTFTFKLLPEDAPADEVVPIFIPPYRVEVRSATLKVVDTRNVDPPLPKRSIRYKTRKP